jgi:hypothetical protein
VESQATAANLQKGYARLQAEASKQAESLQEITSQLSKEKNAHSLTRAELEALHGSSAQQQKAWKADRAKLLCERDGALSQVPPST